MADLLTITELRRAAAAGPVEARIHVQIESIGKKQTRDQKPFFELVVADAAGKLTLRAWSDSPNFDQCAAMESGAFLEISGDFGSHPSFGIDSRRWSCRPLDETERDALLAGPPAVREKQEADYAFIVESVHSLLDPRLRGVCLLFLESHGGRFRRAAAARNYHHSRRGGLVEHTAQMMRAAAALTSVYPALHRDLLLAGVLLHDSGKLWENAMPEDGFAMTYDERGELLGHITIGIELVNTLFRKIIAAPEAADWQTLHPSSEDVRLHLLHLIAAHHGSKEFGSPVDPKTPEAFALNYVDDLDAKLEMIFAGYQTSPLLAPRIHERVRPLPSHLILPLQKFDPPPPPLISDEKEPEQK